MERKMAAGFFSAICDTTTNPAALVTRNPPHAFSCAVCHAGTWCAQFRMRSVLSGTICWRMAGAYVSAAAGTLEVLCRALEC